MPLEYYEVRYKNKNGLWIIKRIEGINLHSPREIIEIVKDGWIISYDDSENIDIDESEDNPKLVLYLKSADIRSLDDIKNLKEVAPYLHFFTATSIPSKIVNVKNFRNLRELKLSGAFINKILGLENLKNLYSISLADTKINSIAGIENLENIYFLDITNTEVSSLEPLKKLNKIKYIHARKCPIRSLHGFTPNPNHLHELLIDPENLCPTGAQLYKTAISRNTMYRNFGIQEIQKLFEFYHISPTNLALQYIIQNSNPKSELNPLTAPEIERLIHESSHKERMILENAVDNKILPHDDPILSKITARFSVYITGDKKIKFLL
ncbi:MAG: hypothetical protein ACTSPA_14885 [Promethearchaeota archaeon]